jgi:hypothetical protein
MADVGLRRRIERLEEGLADAQKRIQDLELSRQQAQDVERNGHLPRPVGERVVQRQTIHPHYAHLGRRTEDDDR